MRFAFYIVVFFITGLMGCAATGIRDVPTHIRLNYIFHVKGKLISDSDKNRPLKGAVVEFIDKKGESKKYLTDSNGRVSFTDNVPTEVHTSSVTFEIPLEEVVISKQGYFSENLTEASGFSHLFNREKWYWGDPKHYTVDEEIILSPNYKKKIIVENEFNAPIPNAKVTALSNKKIVNRWYTNNQGVAEIDLVEACNYGDDCNTLVDKDGYICITNELGYRCFEDDILMLQNVYVKMTAQDDYIRDKCCPELDNHVSRKVSLELAYWLIDMAKTYNMRLDSICIKEYKGKKYLSTSLSSMSKKFGNRLSDYDVAKNYFLLLVIDYIKSPSYATPGGNIDGFNINLNNEVSYVRKNGDLRDKNIYDLQYYFSTSDANAFLNQEISRQQFADKTKTISSGDLIELILR